MRLIPALLASATVALALVAPPPSEAASMSRPGNAGAVRGGGNWSGSHGNWSGRGAWSHGGYRGGHYYGYWRPWYGFYAAAPFLFGASYYYSSWDPYWGYWGPRYYGYAAYPRSYPAYEMEGGRPGENLGPPSEASPSAPGAPQQAPLYMNYCPAAKAYYPKVTACPEGWEFRRPDYRP